MRNAEFEIVRTTLPLPSPLGEGGSADPPPGGCRMRCHPERARRASRRILPRSGGCTFLLLVQKKGTKENDTREGNCGLALPVAGEARPQFPQPRHKVNCRTAAREGTLGCWRAVAKQAREWQMRQGGEISFSVHLAVPEKCCGLTLATGGGLVPCPLPGPTLIETTKRGLRAPFGFPRDSPGNDGRFE